MGIARSVDGKKAERPSVVPTLKLKEEKSCARKPSTLAFEHYARSPWRAGIDPVLKNLLLGGSEGITLRGHDVVMVLGQDDALVNLTLGRVAGYDPRFLGLPRLEDVLAGIDTVIALRFAQTRAFLVGGGMAVDAALLQDGQDILPEVWRGVKADDGKADGEDTGGGNFYCHDMDIMTRKS